MDKGLIKDVMHNLAPGAGDFGITYHRGIVVGLVGGLCANGSTYDEAIELIGEAIPNGATIESFPPPLRKDIASWLK